MKKKSANTKKVVSKIKEQLAIPFKQKALPFERKAISLPKKNLVGSAKIPTNKEKKADFVFINNTFLAAAGIIIVIIFVAVLASKNPKPVQNDSTNNAVLTGQQTAKITILPSGDHGSMHSDSMDESVMSNMYLAGSLPAKDHVKFKISSFQKLAVQPLKFNIYDDNGKELKPDLLQTVHEKKLHLIVVSADLKEYQHLHPQYFNGVWNINANLPHEGTYYAYTDFSPIKGASGVYRNELIVRSGQNPGIKFPGLTPDYLAISNGYQAKMVADSLVPGKSTRLSFQITKDGKPVTNLKPYLGAWGHVVVLRHSDPTTYVHMHPSASTNEEKAIVDFVSTFQAAGRYTAFAEFSFGGKIVVFPITFDVQ